MVKLNRRKLRNVRPKAGLGDALITSGATLAAAWIGASAAKNAADRQAAAIEENARQQADAIYKQNEINTRNQEKLISFNKEQFDAIKKIQQNAQLNLQRQVGDINETQRKESNLIQLKKGGSVRNLRGKHNPYFLRGMNSNLPFVVTDGGGVIPIATTPEGYDLYEIVGNDHEHYHKAQGGKYKTGVGIKFYDINNNDRIKRARGGYYSKTIEGEGNQNSNIGELMLVTPFDAKFISKHSIKGFNPTKAVLAGVHPIDAFNTQEAIKDAYNISDDGKFDNKTPVRNMKTYDVTGMRSLRCGGRVKKDLGGTWYPFGHPFWTSSQNIKLNYTPTTLSLTPSTNGFGEYITPQYNLGVNTELKGNTFAPTESVKQTQPSTANMIGAGITSLGNIGGAIISTIGNNAASRALQQGYNNASGILANAYGNLRTIDASVLRRSDFSAPHVMAAIRNPSVNINPELALIERDEQRRLSSIGKNTLSSAAALNRISRTGTNAYDMRSQVFDKAEQQKEDIRQSNVERITQVANENANRDIQANKEFTKAYIDLLQYNNDIENEKIVGAAQAKADALTQTASTIANTRQANAATWAGTVSNIGLGFGNTLAANAKMANELDMTLLGASLENQVMYYLDHPNAPGKQRLLKLLKNSNSSKYKEWYNALNS